jgi:hypothetical protein
MSLLKTVLEDGRLLYKCSQSRRAFSGKLSFLAVEE